MTEDVSVDANNDLVDRSSSPVASGQLSITDVDAEAFFNAGTIAGTHGSLTIDAAGSWVYEVNSDPPAGGVGQRRDADGHCAVTSLDGTTQDIAIAINGNNPAVIGGSVTGSVKEDVAVDANGDLVASGQLSITDVDANEAFFNAGTIAGTHGSLTITPDGEWTYEVDNDLPAVRGLDEGQFLTDTVTVSRRMARRRASRSRLMVQMVQACPMR